MRKYPAAKDFDAIAGTLPSNARGDGGNEPIVIRNPSAGKGETLYQSAARGKDFEAVKARNLEMARVQGEILKGNGPMDAILDHPGVRAAAPKPVLDKLERSKDAIASFASRPDEWNLLPAIRAAVARLGGVEGEGQPENRLVDALARTLEVDPRSTKGIFEKYARAAGENEPGSEGKGEAFAAFNKAFGSKLTREEFHDGLEEAAQRTHTAGDADLSRDAAGSEGAGGEGSAVSDGRTGIAAGDESGAGSLGGIQLRLGCRAPAIRLGAQVLDLGDGLRGAQKGRHIGGQSTGRKPVDHPMAAIAPGASRRRLSKQAKQSSRG
jgi:hypothetical protein